ncbi:hypothetical protein BJ980_002167 [Nocardioides daedukensis]|uniref:DNA lyase n=1 Tax=Nocardioides daedukensis TaxID=634462 RepID=A0A7Y9S3W6_9ACTN|nr:hypothetical protein [Nocardioides daedukensis]
MRIWSIHPEQLDVRGLVACWRETLLAQKVLQGLTKGYTRHPQLVRFRATDDPVQAIATYLHAVADEADARAYSFNRALLVAAPDPDLRIEVTDGQVDHEWQHLLAKLALRDPQRHDMLRAASPRVHPLFEVVPGPVADWEVR